MTIFIINKFTINHYGLSFFINYKKSHRNKRIQELLEVIKANDIVTKHVGQLVGSISSAFQLTILFTNQ